MSQTTWEMLTFAAVGVPALGFAVWKAWLALLLIRGTRVSTDIGRWLIRLYGLVAAACGLIGVAYLLTVADRSALLAERFETAREWVRLVIGVLFLGGIVASFRLWRAVQALEAEDGP
jgi:hypothetical protein